MDESGESRCAEFTTRVARTKTAIELMNESDESRCAEFTTRVEQRFAKVPPGVGVTKTRLQS